MIAQGVPDLAIHFMQCGQGNMVLVVTPPPDPKVLLCDCRVVEDEEEALIGYLEQYIPERVDFEARGELGKWIDWFICSHRDEDHIHGLKAVNAAFPVRGIVDPGTTSGSTTGTQTEYYMRLRREIRKKYRDGAVIEAQPTLSPLFVFGGVGVYCLCSGVDDEPDEEGHYGNVVLQMEYAGNRVLLPGDSDWRAWKDKIVPQFGQSGLLKTTVLLASHHGSRSFFVDVDPTEEENWDSAYYEHLELIAPSVTVISVGAQDAQNHPNATALRKYERHTSHEQVYLTREKGTLVGCFYSDGRWTVIPSRFLRTWDYRRFSPGGKRFWLSCQEYDGANNYLGEVKSGSRVPIGHRLRFMACSSGGLVGGVADATYAFEVSNGGISDDADHDQIYYKKRSEEGPPNTFNRDVAYHGTHLLRCHVKSKATGQVAQDLFVVHGVHA